MRLIDLDELQKFPIRIDHYDKENGDLKFILGIEVVFDYAESLPVIEQEPGRWEAICADNRGYTYAFTCSSCGTVTRVLHPLSKCDYKFCPWCGARMDGDNDAAD